MDIVDLNLFENRMQAVCEEMGLVLKRAAISTNIKDRLDFSTAIFDSAGALIAQAAHIPVHLGSMAFAMADIVADFDWTPGDVLVLNNPFLGGTHLPDVTVVTPVFVGGQLLAFVAGRAHHANIGTDQPGGMPLASSVHEEGILISPSFLVRGGVLQTDVMATIAGVSEEQAAPHRGHPHTADFFAQIAANNAGQAALARLVEGYGAEGFSTLIDGLNHYAERLSRAALEAIPDGSYSFEDFLDDDGFGSGSIKIAATITAQQGKLTFDFAGTSGQVQGNLNCPLPVTAAAVFYVTRCLLPVQAPACAGLFGDVTIEAPLGCLVNAQFPAAVAAGNVETSMRIVDVLLGALAPALPEKIPAAAQGTMNNLAMGGRTEFGASADWDYYETMAGGLGGHAADAGLSAVQAHMTNTLNTPLESLENHYPLRVRQLAVRPSSGGAGRFCGGNGMIRELEFLEPAQVCILSERRQIPPWGLFGGSPGVAGRNSLNGELLSGKATFMTEPGDVLRVETPGGGGYGSPQ